MVAEEFFCNYYNINPVTLIQNVIFKVYYKTIFSRVGAGRRRNLGLRLSELEPKEIFSAPEHWFR